MRVTINDKETTNFTQKLVKKDGDIETWEISIPLSEVQKKGSVK